MSNFLSWVSEQKLRVEVALDESLGNSTERLAVAMRHSVLSAGKRIRALLVYACASAVGAKLEDYTPAAVALELIHAYSLVHDDLPCMDDDDLRRGQPSCHIAFDEPTALLVGDALQSLAFLTIALPNPALHSQQQLLMSQTLASAAYNMVLGQALDIGSIGQSVNEVALRDMHHKKTGSLIEAAVRIGSATGSEEMRTILAEYAYAIGLAYQIVDDILDATTPSKVLGKTTGKDARFAKPTFVTVLGLAVAKEQATHLRARALNLLHNIEIDHPLLLDLTQFILPSHFGQT